MTKRKADMDTVMKEKDHEKTDLGLLDLFSELLRLIHAELNPLDQLFLASSSARLWSILKPTKKRNFRKLLFRHGTRPVLTQFIIRGWSTSQLDDVVYYCRDTDNAEGLAAMYDICYDYMETWCKEMRMGSVARLYLLHGAVHIASLYDCASIVRWLWEEAPLGVDLRRNLIFKISQRIQRFPEVVPKLIAYMGQLVPSGDFMTLLDIEDKAA